jgi:tRNA threonylcarbamoyladenosine biosynthesis protein TsaB
VILAIDTSTEILSVCLTRSGDLPPDALHVEDSGLNHGRTLMVAVDTVLKNANLDLSQIDLVACSGGPGSFTGLRIGLSTAKGLAESLCVLRSIPEPPLVVVPTFDALSWQAREHDWTLLVIDGRKGRFYGALSRHGERVTPDLDCLPAELLARARQHSLTAPLVIGGPHAAEFVQRIEASEPPHGNVVVTPGRRGCAEGVAALAGRWLSTHGFAPRDIGPSYVRRSDAEIAKPTPDSNPSSS